jgi:GPH family glycoside/pentoside/hexuronide:cation symporter
VPAKVAYGLGHFGLSLIGYVVVAYVMPFYDPPDAAVAEGARRLVVTGALMGLIILLSRNVDYVVDPLAGFLSDRLRSRWGRRKPFMVVCAPGLVLAFVLLWHPPLGEPSAANAIYAGIVCAAVFVFFAGFGAPYLALLPEIATSERERVQLAGIQGAFNLAGIATAALAFSWIAPRWGVAHAAHAVALLCALALTAACLGPREGAGGHAVRPSSSLGLRQSLSRTFTNLPFLFYWGGYYFFWLGLLILLSGMEYTCAELLGVRVGGSALVLSWGLLCGLACLPVASWLALRWGHRRAFLASQLWFVVVAPLLGLAGWHTDPAAGIWLARLGAVLLGPAIAGLFALPYTILAEVCDRDYLRTGEYREAMYFGFQGMMFKAGIGFAPLLVAAIMEVMAAGPQPELACRLFGPAAGLSALVAVVVFRWYPQGAPELKAA